MKYVAAVAYHFCLALPAARCNLRTTFWPSLVNLALPFRLGEDANGVCAPRRVASLAVIILLHDFPISMSPSDKQGDRWGRPDGRGGGGDGVGERKRIDLSIRWSSDREIFIDASWFLGYNNFTALLFHGLNSFHLEVFRMLSREIGANSAP